MFSKVSKISAVVVILLLVFVLVMAQVTLIAIAATLATEETALAAEGLACRLRTEVKDVRFFSEQVYTDPLWWQGEAYLKKSEWAKAQATFETISGAIVKEIVLESYQGPSVPKSFFDFASEAVVLQELSLADLKVRVQRASNPPQEVVLYDGEDKSLVVVHIDQGFLMKFPELILQYNLWEDARQVTFYVESPVVRIYIRDTMGRTPSLDLFDTNYLLSKWQFLGEIGPGSVTERTFSGGNYDCKVK